MCLAATGMLFLPLWPVSCHATGAYVGGSVDSLGHFRPGGATQAALLDGLVAIVCASAIVAFRPALRIGLVLLAAGCGLIALKVIHAMSGRSYAVPAEDDPWTWVLCIGLPLMVIGALGIVFHIVDPPPNSRRND